MSWVNPVTSLDLSIWDIDSDTTSDEALQFVTSALVSPISLHPTDVWVPKP